MKTSVTVWFKKAIAAIAFVLPVSAFTQSIYIYPTATTAPRGSYQTVTAIVTGVNDKTVTWSSDGGTIVGTNPCVVNEPCTIALYTTNTGTYHLTATSNANNSAAATSTVTFTNSPTPRTDHPRFIVTPDTVTALRSKAIDGNPMYQAIKTRANYAINSDNPIWSWSCNGGTGKPNSDQSQSWKEQDAYLFAIMSVIAPTATERNQWGCYGHDVFLTMAGYVLGGSLDLSQGNHWSDSARQLTLTPDLLMGGGYLSSTTDLNTTRQYLAKIAYEQINDIYNGTLAVIGSYNSPSQLQETSENSITGMRAMGNNYTQSRILYLAAAALTFNDTPTDDPALPNTCGASRYQVCPDGTAGSLHAYWSYVSGGLLYKDWGNIEDPTVAQQAYNTAFSNMPSQPMCNTLWHSPIPCFGLGRGGEANEGTSYGTSLSRLRWAMNAIHTAGYDDPIQYGPQMSIATSSYWDLRYVADLSLLTGLSGISSEKSRWNFLTDGDTLYYYVYPSNYVSESAMLAANSYTGRTDGNAAMQWLITNSAFGTANGSTNCSNYCGFDSALVNDYGFDTAWDLFVALPAVDPVTVNPPADPRPSLPIDWYDAGNQHIVARSGWGNNTNTVFSYYCTNTQIDHEHEYCGGFDLYSQGEYITKGRTEFNDYNNKNSAAINKNVPAYINTPTDTSCTYANGCYWADMTQLGGQFWHGYQAGLDTLLHSEMTSYVAAVADSTNTYNGGWGGFGSLNNITQASRSLVYLRGSNQIVYYDRGASGANVWDKANYLVTTGAPSISGNTASWLTRSGNQRVYWTSLSPGQAPVLDATFTDGNTSSDWEIYGRLKVDAGNVASARFLSVLQWGSAGFGGSSAAMVKSTAGNSFEGALVGSSLVMFMRDWPTGFTSVTYPASNATTQYVSDLTPNTLYSISGTGAPATATTDNAGVLKFNVAGTGSITISAGAAAAPAAQIQTITVSPASANVQATATQQYSASCKYSDGSTSSCTSSVVWSSNSTTVATVDSTGLVTGVSQGTASIIATAGSIQGQASVTVPAATLQTINVSPASATINVGGTQQLKATGVYSDSSTVDMTNSVNWSSSNASVVSTTPGGLAAGMTLGNANVIATSGTVHGQASIAVTQTATPSFVPAGGTYTSAQTVTISSSTPSSVIYYTTNGATPTTSSAVYSGPITVSTSETVQAIAVAAGSSASSVASATYTITSAAAAPVFSPGGGTYTSAQAVTISTSTPGATIFYTTDGSTPTTSSAVYTSPVTVSSSETLRAIAVASGYTNSAVASAVYTINAGSAVAPLFSPAPGRYTSVQTVTISTSTPSATIYYTIDGSKPTRNSPVYGGPITVAASTTIKAFAVSATTTVSSTTSGNYIVKLSSVAAPTFSPSGGKYTSIQTVSITSGTPGATIYFTTDGTTPTTSSQLYSGPLTVATSETVKAIAVASGYNQSSVSSASYTINLPSPAFSLKVSSNSVTVTRGHASVTNVQIIPENGFEQPVELSCSGLPAGATCSFAPGVVTPLGAPASTVLTISAPEQVASNSHDTLPGIPGTASLAMLGFCSFGRKKKRLFRLLSVALFGSVALSFCTGCAGQMNYTPDNSSVVTVVGAHDAMQPTTTFTLTLL